MAVPAIALYASPPSSVCSTPYPCDFDFNGRSTSSASASASASQKTVVGGLSCLFSASPAVKHPCYSSGTDDLGSLRNDRGDELSSSFRCSSLNSSLKRDQSPISVLQGPFSCSSTNGLGSYSRSPPMRIPGGDVGSFRSGTSRLFSGFVRHALASSIDYDSRSFQAQDTDSSSLLLDDLTFNMDENSVELASEPYAKDLLLGAQMRHKIFHDDLVIKAFQEAEKAHKGQVRASGDPYLQHCMETAVLLANIGANSTVVAAGLLHDTLDDTFVTKDYIFERFGSGVADLVEGVSKLSQVSKLARENNTASKTIEADRLHTMFLAMTDARAVLIKLADRLHNMMTLDALPLVKQERFAKETLEIFAPLANRLGISTWKEKLENLCFKYLYPAQYEELSSRLLDSFDEAIVTSAKTKLEQGLKDGAISYHALSGRHKSLYSIRCKMMKKNLTMDEIHDIHGLRLIVENEEDCYKALKLVRQLWPEVPGRFKDYITNPKFNGYQSLHTVVIDEGMVPLEVQIRTKKMHLQAEYGLAAHWRYKEGDCKHSSFELQMVEWARWVLTWHFEATSRDQSSILYGDSVKPSCKFPYHSESCPYTCGSHCQPDGPVYIIMIENEKMSVQELKQNSTIMDLLERTGQGIPRWTAHGFPMKEELRPRVNHEPVVDPCCKLKMGDVVDLTPAIPNKSLVEYREEIQRMYDRGLPVKNSLSAATSTMVGLGS